EVDDHPELRVKHDIVGELFGFHQSSHAYASASEINTVAFLALFGNLPKLLSGLGALIFSNQALSEKLKAHIQEIDDTLTDAQRIETEYAPNFPLLDKLLNDE